MASGELDLNAVLMHLGANGSVADGLPYADHVGGAALDRFGSGVRERLTTERVVQTARELPSTDSCPVVADPTADHEDAALVARKADVDEKHRRIVEYLDRTGHEAVLLSRADSLAWLTSGGDLSIDAASEGGSAWAFVNRRCRSLLTDNVQSARLFEQELAGLGFQLKERPWFEDPDALLADLCRSKRIASDAPRDGLIGDAKGLHALRHPLTPVERQRLRELGRTLALAVEATCRNFRAGETETHVAGHLAHRLLREGVAPVVMRVSGDGRLERFRQPVSKAEPIRHRATISAVGRRHGLCAALTRTVCFGKPDAPVKADHTLATMVDATCIFFSRPHEPVTEVFRRARRIYEKFDHPHEWTLDYQGAQIGYAPRELVFRPDCPATLAHGMAVCWSPSVNSARSEDTVVVDDRGYEVVTEAQDWPKIEVQVKGYTLPRPAILER